MPSTRKRMFDSFFQKRAAKKALAKLVSPQAVADCLAGFENQSLKEGQVELILAMVRGDTADLVSERVRKVAQIGTQRGACVDAAIGPLVAISLGTIPGPQTQVPDRPGLVNELRRHLGEEVKIVHAAERGHFGLIGGRTWGAILPHFNAMLETMTRLEFGQSEEVHL